MKLFIDRASTVSLYLQLYEAIREKILSGQLIFGSRLPSERMLSQRLDVNRHTVMTAYDLLKSDGLIESFSGRGTFVTYKESSDAPRINHSIYNWTDLFERKQGKKHDNIIEVIMDSHTRDNTYFFAGGLPSNKSIPNQTFAKLSSDLLKLDKLNVLSYSAVSGVDSLKHALKKQLTYKTGQISVNELLITSGAQQALDLIFKTFLEPGDTVLIEEPSFFGAIELLKHYGATIVTIPMDEDGMQTSILEYMIQRHQPKFIYTIPTYHNPTGLCMSLERRQSLIDLSIQFNVPIIEDDPYSAIRYEGEEYPTLKSLDPSNHVIYISTFSKTLSLGLRIGWIVAAEEVIKQLIKIKQISDLHVNTLNQYTLAEFISTKDYDQHIKTVTQDYKEKRDLMLDALYKHFEDITVVRPTGGFYIWLTLNKPCPMRQLFEECHKENVLITPAYHFAADGKDRNAQIRLNFTYPDKQEIIDGIEKLAICYKKILNKHKGD